jgi:hypothetical protein
MISLITLSPFLHCFLSDGHFYYYFNLRYLHSLLVTNNALTYYTIGTKCTG